MRRGRPRKGKPPAKPGFYRFCDLTNNEERYFGETNDLASRKKQHERAGRVKLGTFEYQLAPDGVKTEDRRAWERSQIEKHSKRGPIANKRKGGGGRFSK